METNSFYSEESLEGQIGHNSINQYLDEIEGDIKLLHTGLARMGSSSSGDAEFRPVIEGKYSNLNTACFNTHVVRMEHYIEDLLYNHNLKNFIQKLETVVVDAVNLEIDNDWTASGEDLEDESTDAHLFSEPGEISGPEQGEEISPFVAEDENTVAFNETTFEFSESFEAGEESGGFEEESLEEEDPSFSAAEDETEIAVQFDEMDAFEETQVEAPLAEFMPENAVAGEPVSAESITGDNMVEEGADTELTDAIDLSAGDGREDFYGLEEMAPSQEELGTELMADTQMASAMPDMSEEPIIDDLSLAGDMSQEGEELEAGAYIEEEPAELEESSDFAASEELEEDFKELNFEGDAYSPDPMEALESDADVYAETYADIPDGEVESEIAGGALQAYLGSDDFEKRLAEQIEEAIYSLVNDKLPEIVERVVNAEIGAIKDKIRSTLADD